MWTSISRAARSHLLLVALCSTVQAAPSASVIADGQAITLDEAISKTLEHNPQLRAFGYQVDIKRGRLQQASLPPNPELLVTVEDALGTGAYQAFKNAETTISLGWVFERGIREHRVTAALASESLTAVEIEILRVDVAAETARRFLTLMAQQARSAIARDAMLLAETTITAVQQRVSVGRSPEADLARAQAELAYAKLALDDFEHELQIARHRLAAQWGSTTPDFDSAMGNPYILPDVVSFQLLKQQAEHNPEMSRYLAKQRLDEAELQLAEAQRKPAWKGAIGMRRYESVDDFALVTSLTIPLTFRNRNQGNIAEAHAVLEQTLAATAAAKVDILTALYGFYELLQHTMHRANALRSEVLPRIEFALTQTRAAYEQGRYNYFEWRAAQAELIEAQNALIETSINAHRNVIEIERLTGVRVAQPGSAQ